MSDFETEHAKWLNHHLDRRTGERRLRLEMGHAHAEKLFLKNVWWPIRGNFDDLHPEYEVLDWRRRPYFADFMWTPGLVRLNLEVKGWGPHVRDADRRSYSDELNRETFMYGMGIHTISFAYHDVENRPDVCRQLLRMVLNNLEAAKSPSHAVLLEKELVKLMVFQAAPIRPAEIAKHLDIDRRTAIKMLRTLCDKGWLKPVARGNSGRQMAYELDRRALEFFFF
jgi:predicted DNA-binding transcriptional regulator